MAKVGDASQNIENIWIKEDNPVQASKLSRHKDDYEDIVQDRRTQSDFRFSTRNREIPAYKYNRPRTLAKLKKDVMSSDRVRYTIEQVATLENKSLEVVQHQAEIILAEMAHNQNMTSARFFAFFLIKTIKALYRRVYVNEAGIQQVRSLIKEYPVILMPTHRSYADFLIMSYVFFHYDLPLPVIAAAMDFMSMKFVGNLFRNCGAFFIRRAFGMDKLYWAVFTEFVQTHIENSDNPVEFFVEGTRSRTGKSYLPKQGMLSVVLEPFFKAQVPDVMIVPISISYDRILEEGLYAFEQLGIPKPKESTSGLLKARSVLQEDFGNIHLHFGDPISVRQYSDGKIDRIIHSLAPRYVYGLTNAEQEMCSDLAYDIVTRHQQLMVISPWALIATVILQNKDGIYLPDLTREVTWLKRCAGNLGGYIDWEGSESAEVIVRKHLTLHHNIIQINQEDFVSIRLVEAGHVTVRDDVIVNAATHIMLASYRNHVIHCFAHVAIISTIINSTSIKDTITIEELYRRYSFLENILSKDFVYKPGTTRKHFDEAVKLLVNCSELVMLGDVILVKKSVNKYSLFISQMFEPFLLSYWILCEYLLCSMMEMNNRPTARRYDHVTREVQALIVRLLQENLVKHQEMLSLNLLSNGLLAVTDMGAVRKERREKHNYALINPVEMAKVTEQLVDYIEVPAVPLSDFTVHTASADIQAKL